MLKKKLFISGALIVGVCILVTGMYETGRSAELGGTIKAPYVQTIDTFFQKLRAGNTNEAVDFIYSGNPWITAKKGAIQNVKDTLSNFPNMGGRFQGQAKLGEKVLGGRYVCLYYMAAYERQPLGFTFEFYKSKDKWVIHSFSFDDKLDDQAQAGLLEEVFEK